MSQQAIKFNFEDRGLSDRLKILSNGQEVVEYFEHLLKEMSIQKIEETH